MATFWAKVDADLHANPKIRRAGRNAREVYQHVLRINAGTGSTGAIDISYLDPEVLAYELQMSVDEAREGVERCLATFIAAKGPLLVVEGDMVVLPRWDDEEHGRGEASMTERDRKALQRERKRSARAQAETAPCPDMSGQPEERPDSVRKSGPGEEKRSEETRSEDSLFPPGGSTAARDCLSAAIVALNHHRSQLRPKSEPLRGMAIHLGPASPEAKAIETISRVPEADRYRLIARAIEVLVFRVAAGELDFGDLRPGYLFGASAFDGLVAAWPPKAKARAGPPDRSRRGGATGSAPPSADLSATGTVDPNEIHLP